MSDFFSEMQDRYRRRASDPGDGSKPPASANGDGLPHWALSPTSSGAQPAAGPTHPQPAIVEPEERYTLDSFWEMLLRRRHWIVATALLITLAGGYKTYTKPSQYRARASFTDTRVDAMHRDRREQEIDWWQGDAPVHEARLLQSRSLLQDMVGRIPDEVKRMKLPPDPQLDALLAGLSWQSMIGAIEIVPAKGEKRLITVHATSTHPVLAAAMANATTQAISVQSLKWRQERAGALVDTLGKIVRSKGVELEQFEERIQQENRRLMALGKKAQDLTKETAEQLRVVGRLRFERDKSVLALQEMETRIAQLQRKIKEAAPESGTSVDLSSATDPYAQKITALRIKLTELQQRFTPSNPKVRALEQQLEAMLEERRQMMARQLRSARRDEGPLVNRLKEALYLAEIDRKGIQDRLRSYEKVIESRSQALISTDDAQLPLAKLKTHKQVLIKVIANLEQRKAEAAVEAGVEDSGIRQVDEASPPGGPQGAARSMLLVGWILAGLVSGLLLAYLLDSLSSTIKGPGPVQRLLGLPTLGLVPWIRTDDRRRYIDPASPTGKLAEACGVIRNNIRFSIPGALDRPLLITSPLPGEGKSMITANLAIAFALEGNSVLLIDGDLRRKRPVPFHEAIEVPDDQTDAGLCEYLRGSATLDQVIYPSRNIGGLHWLPGGKTPSNPALVLRSGLLARLYDEASARFDVVIVDSPALLPIADTVQMARGTHVVLVLANEETRINAAAQAAHRLQHIGAPMVGVVINKAAGYVTSHYYGYSRYYAYRYAYSDE